MEEVMERDMNTLGVSSSGKPGIQPNPAYSRFCSRGGMVRNSSFVFDHPPGVEVERDLISFEGRISEHRSCTDFVVRNYCTSLQPTVSEDRPVLGRIYLDSW